VPRAAPHARGSRPSCRAARARGDQPERGRRARGARRRHGGGVPKPLTDEVVRAADVVITMGCGDACPIYPGKKYEDWELDDPAGQDLDTVRRIRDDLDQLVRKLVAELLPGGDPSTTEPGRRAADSAARADAGGRRTAEYVAGDLEHRGEPDVGVCLCPYDCRFSRGKASSPFLVSHVMTSTAIRPARTDGSCSARRRVSSRSVR
jgi:Low molecular weight phosphotyrosine protein phosphatase